ncbi:MAG: PDZ domain-containing protein [Gemmatimonadales bacterium]
MSQYQKGSRATLALITALTTLSFMPAVLAAQDNEPGEVHVFTFGRPRIGVRVDVRANAETDKLGARIAEVTEDGPAAKAGLKDGDIITRFNGVSLGGVKSEEEDDASGPGLKLIALARKLDGGDTVDVEYRRGSESRKAKIIAADGNGPLATRGFQMTPDPMGSGTMREFRMPRLQLDGPGGGNQFYFQGPNSGAIRVFGRRMDGGLDLTDLNADLGEYFGAKEGVLVLRAPSDSGNPLKAGDVIVAIDGRATKNEMQARRILGSYGPGESAKVDLLRKQKKLTVTWKPAQEGEWKVQLDRPGRMLPRKQPPPPSERS